MLRWIALVAASALSALAQYKASVIGPPAGLAPAITQALASTGFQVTGESGPYCEIWFRATLPSGPATTAENVTMATVPAGTFLGVIRFDGQGSDRRGQTIHAGVYTLRYAIMPTTSSHEGAAPQRDFLLLSPAASDPDPNFMPKPDDLLNMSRKASGTPHPAVLSFWKADADSPGFSEQRESDWVLQSKVGDTPIDVILVGTAGS